MSSTPTSAMTAPKSSGRWSITAATSRPPLLPPLMHSCGREVMPRSMRNSAAAMKSSKPRCLLALMPLRCQSSPYSPPPRMFATAYTPPNLSTHRMREMAKPGVSEMEKPPYPYRMVGLGAPAAAPPSTSPLRPITTIGILVPSPLS